MEKPRIYLTVAAAILLAGCEKAAKEAYGPLPEPRTTVADVAEEYEEALEATGALAGDAKAEFISRMNMRLRNLERDVDALGLIAKNLTGAAKKEADETLVELNSKRVRARQKTEEFASSTGEAWKELESGVSDAIDELDEAFDEAQSKFDG